MSQSAPSPSPSKRMSLSSHAQLKEIKVSTKSPLLARKKVCASDSSNNRRPLQVPLKRARTSQRHWKQFFVHLCSVRRLHCGFRRSEHSFFSMNKNLTKHFFSEGSPNGSGADSLRAMHDKVEHSPGSPARRALIVRREDAMSSPASRTSPRCVHNFLN